MAILLLDIGSFWEAGMKRKSAILASMLCSLVLDVANAEDGGPLSFPKWEPSTTEYTRVQTGDWIDEERFVVGRWDGSVAVFRKPSAGEYNP